MTFETQEVSHRHLGLVVQREDLVIAPGQLPGVEVRLPLAVF